MSKLKTLWKNLPSAWRFSLLSVTLMRLFYTVWSLLFLSLFSLVTQNHTLFGEPVVTIFDLQTSRAFVYDRLVNGVLLTFTVADQAHMTDTQTGSMWRISDGQSVSGPNQGSSLSPANITSERVFPYYGVLPHPVSLLAIWQRFDANWYLAIAENGYGDISGDVHFPPLYPAWIRLLSTVLRNGFFSALLISQVSLYIMVKVLHDLFTGWGDQRLAERSLLFFLIFPTSFFFFSAYTEATFVIFAILCLRAIQNQTWHWAGFWIFCAILIRLQGIALFLPLGYGLWRVRFRDIHMGKLFFTVFSPLIAIGVYLMIRLGGGDPAVIPLTEANLHARIVPPWENILYSFTFILGKQGGYIDVLNLVAFTLFGVLIIVYWKKIPMEYNLFSIASLILLSMRLVDTQPLNSMIRYVLTLFPVYYVFGIIARHKWMNLILFASLLSLNLFLSAQFFLWGWVA